MFIPSRKVIVRLALLSAVATSGLLFSDGVRASDLIDQEMSVTAAPAQSRIDTAWGLLHNWKVVVGAGAAYQPEYEGGDKFEVSPIPYVSIQPYDWLKIDPTGATITALTAGSATLDLKVGYDSGRSEDDASTLRGMGDIDFGATVGATASYSLGPADFFLSAEKTIGGSEGFLATAGVAFTQPVTDRLILGADASATFADESYMQAYFGVTSAQASRSGHARYTPEAGVKSVDLSVSATYLINDNWFVKGKQSVGILMGDAADSPLVENDIVPKTMLLIGYKF